jgi:hypothetical protein
MIRELAERLLAVMDRVPRGRAELLQASGLRAENWRPVIRELCSSGKVVQLGTTKGALYARGPCPLNDARGYPAAGASPRSDYVGRLLDAIDDVPRGRGELIHRGHLTMSDWNEAIGELVDRGLVHRLGDKGGARYVRASSAGELVAFAASPATHDRRQDFRESAHHVVEDLLREFGLDEGPRVSSRDEGLRGRHISPSSDTPGASAGPGNPAAKMASEQVRGVHERVPPSASTRGDGQSSAPPSHYVPGLAKSQWVRAAEPTSMSWDKRNYEILDNRASGGCLWIVDSPEAREYVQHLNRCGAGFALKAAGARATGGRTAWWTKRTDVVL